MMKKHGMLMGACCLFILQGCEKLDTFPSKKGCELSTKTTRNNRTAQLSGPRSLGIGIGRRTITY
ncbi:hypothetical protein ACT7DB_18110 [Bacillus cereus]